MIAAQFSRAVRGCGLPLARRRDTTVKSQHSAEPCWVAPYTFLPVTLAHLSCRMLSVRRLTEHMRRGGRQGCEKKGDGTDKKNVQRVRSAPGTGIPTLWW